MDSPTINTPFASTGAAVDGLPDDARWSAADETTRSEAASPSVPELGLCPWPDWQTSSDAFNHASANSNLPLDASPVTLRIVVGTSRNGSSSATLREAGQLLVLDQAATAPVEIHHGERVVARGHLRSYDGRYCVQITEVLARVDESRLSELVDAKE